MKVVRSRKPALAARGARPSENACFNLREKSSRPVKAHYAIVPIMLC